MGNWNAIHRLSNVWAWIPSYTTTLTHTTPVMLYTATLYADGTMSIPSPIDDDRSIESESGTTAILPPHRPLLSRRVYPLSPSDTNRLYVYMSNYEVLDEAMEHAIADDDVVIICGLSNMIDDMTVYQSSLTKMLESSREWKTQEGKQRSKDLHTLYHNYLGW